MNGDGTKPDIRAVLVRHGAVSVPSRQGWRPMLCPYHDDTSPSAAVNLLFQEFVCHGCGVRGDSYALLAHVTGETDFTRLVELGGGFNQVEPRVPRKVRERGVWSPPGRRGRRRNG